MKILCALLLIAASAPAAVTNVRIAAVTHTQAVLRFTAPDTSACTVEVSEESDYDPVVHDLNGTHYSGANLDSREPALVQGRERTVVIGKRTIERAVSGVAYSRALQAATLHYYRISCGADTATGTFTTASIPLGDTHGDAPIVDPDNPGLPMRITPQFARNSTWIDPHTGALIKRVHQPQDNNIGQQFNDNLPASVLESTNWADPSNVLTVNSTSTTYDGASCGATCDWLKLSFSYVIVTSNENRLDVLRISINGSGNDATAANRTVEVCPVTLGATTIDAEGACKDIVLPQTTAAKVTATAAGIQDTWRAPGKHEWTLVQIAPFAAVRFAVRKKNSTGTIAIDAVRFDAWQSTTSNVGTGGSYDRCSTVLRGDGRYLCSSFNANGAVNLYAIHEATGESTFLGAVYSNNSRAMTVDNWLWSASDANKWYGQGSGDTDQYEYTYTGDGSEVAAGTKVTLTQTALRAGGEVLGTAVQTFVAAHTAEYSGRTFSPTDYPCPVDAVHGDYLMMSCKRNGSDTYGWLAVYQISTTSIVAAMPMFAAPASRWCLIHARDTAGASPASLISTQFFKNQKAGNGYHQSTLVGGIDADDTAVTVTSTCGGDATCSDPAYATGEPVATVGDDFLQAAETGDVFAIDSEYIRIGTKNSPTSWTIVRGVNGSTPASHSNGATFNATCANKPGAGPTEYVGTPMMVWDFLGDPYGMDATGTYTWLNSYTGHESIRLNTLVANKSTAQSAEGTYILTTVKDPTYAANVPEASTFAGKAAPGPGNTWQQHPNNGHISASASERKFFFDVRPFQGGGGVNPATVGCTVTNAVYPASGGCAAARVSGLTNVYQIATTSADANPDDLNPKHFEIFGTAGTRTLRDISGPGSVLDDSAGKDYTLCHVLIADECVSGSSPGQTYAQVPSLATFYCNTAQTIDLCLSDFMGTGASLSHYGFLPNKEGLSATSAANSAAYGSGWTRRLAMHGLTMSPWSMSAFSTGKPLANGKWVLATDWMEFPYGRGLVSLVKVPPIVKDTVNRSTFVPVEIKVSTVPATTSTVVARFGYAEHSAPTNFYCTSRAEACLANKAAVDITDPFSWASEAPAGLSCASGCTITIPGLPGRLVYHRLEYRNSGGSVIHTGPLEVASAF